MANPTVTFSAERRNRKFNNGEQVYKTMRSALTKKTIPDLKREHNLRVANWKSDVSFRGKSEAKGDTVIVGIYAGGADWKIWFYVDRGTRPHKIRAKNAPFLAFIGGTYNPKTKPVGKYGGSGTVSGGNFVAVQVVNHPGNEARLLSQTIAEEYQPTLVRDMRIAMKIGINK